MPSGKRGKRPVVVSFGKGNAIGVQCLVRIALGPVGAVDSVFPVAEERVTDIGKMGADLVGTAGKEGHFQQGAVPDAGQCAVACADGFGIGAGTSVENLNGIGSGVFDQEGGEGSGGRIGDPVHDTEIEFVNLSVPDFPVHDA